MYARLALILQPDYPIKYPYNEQYTRHLGSQCPVTVDECSNATVVGGIGVQTRVGSCSQSNKGNDNTGWMGRKDETRTGTGTTKLWLVGMSRLFDLTILKAAK